MTLKVLNYPDEVINITAPPAGSVGLFFSFRDIHRLVSWGIENTDPTFGNLPSPFYNVNFGAKLYFETSGHSAGFSVRNYTGFGRTVGWYDGILDYGGFSGWTQILDASNTGPYPPITIPLSTFPPSGGWDLKLARFSTPTSVPFDYLTFQPLPRCMPNTFDRSVYTINWLWV